MKQRKKNVFRRTVTLLLAAAMMLGLQTSVFANQVTGPTEALRVDTSLNINPPIPGHEPENESAEPIIIIQEEPAWAWYPISVTNEVVNGFNAIRRTYALPPDVNPAVISTDAIEMFGQTFNFAYIQQQHTANETFMDLRYSVQVETSGDSMADILSQLEQELWYERDGFAGTLALDIHSINTETAGTSRHTTTATRQRQFPHLSSPDNALIPRTIVDNGRTFYLASVEWVGQGGGSAVDGHQVSSTFTANATFSAQVTQTRTTGYVTTAEYVGTVFRTTPGHTIFTAIFYGEPIIEVWLDEPTQTEPAPVIMPEEIIAPQGEAPVTPVPEGEQKTSNLPLILSILGGLLALAGVAVGGFFVAKHLLGYNVTIYSHHSPREIVKAGRIKLNLNSIEPVIVLDGVVGSEPARTGIYTVQIAQRAVKQIIGKTVRIVLGNKEALHQIPGNNPGEIPPQGSFYDFDVNFSDDDDFSDDDL